MASGFTELRGEVVPIHRLRLSRAQAVARLVGTETAYPFVRLVECRAIQTDSDNGNGDYQEVVVLDTDVEVPQTPTYDVRRVERIAAVFREDDLLPPEALALRDDFPNTVPHLNIRPLKYPPSLCLSDRQWDEDRLRWTARGFIERVRWWLAETAEGKLHHEDQPLEPLLMGFEASIVLPHDLFEHPSDLPERLHCIRREGHESDDDYVVVAEREPRTGNKEPAKFVAVPLGFTPPVTHGVIRWQPNTLEDLHEFLAPFGLDVLEVLKKRIRQWHSDNSLLSLLPIFIVGIPKRRDDTGDIEAVDVWAFLGDKTIGEVGECIGALQRHDGAYGIVLGTQSENLRSGDVALGLMRPYFSFNRREARRSNGLVGEGDVQIVAIGMGALGSQVFDTLIRAGFGHWTLVDDDSLLPHNLARHALDAGAVGYPKPITMAINANRLLNEPQAATPVVTNILRPGKNAEKWKGALQKAEVLLDMSASVAAARHLGRDLEPEVHARRISAFLTPSGNDLVVLAENADRNVRLDALEMQYYRAVATLPELAGHLQPGNGRKRYGRSCRDLSQIMSQEAVMLHAAIASRSVRQTIGNKNEASIRVWHASADLSVESVVVPVYPCMEFPTGTGWTLSTDACLLDKVRRLREQKLPAETGGVLVGSVDTQRRIVYVVDVLPSPPDSVESPTGYVRGSEGLRVAVERVSDATAGWLEYIGEWHSHPRGYCANPSPDDRVLFEWLGEHLAAEDHPPVMLIAGENERWYVGAL